jgi:hypothetical protein|tara:strand:+ start:133 stop:693 length:561 start_codon:yes stop_codon:yes gene_type:complete
MAVTIVATVGSATANSYITLSDANDLVDAMVNSTDVAKWATGTDDTRNRALATATQRLDRERFLGARATDTQALQWPRTGVRKPDTYLNTYAVGFPFRITTDYYTDTEVPDQIKRAQVELAVYLKNNVDGLGLSGLEDYKNVQIGSLNVTPDKFGAVGADRIPPMVERYLTDLRISGPGNVAIKRS